MSIEIELNKKGGRVCEMARSGEVHCPLIVRPTSEDVVTGNVFGILKHVPPHLWLNPLLNHAIDGNADSKRFRQTWFKDFTIRLWERQPRVPSELIGFKEGRTEPDIIIEWENPATTIWIEAKWNSPMAAGTTHDRENDQITRGIRTLTALRSGDAPNRLFNEPKRRLIWLALTRQPLDVVMQKHPRFESQCMFGTATWGDIRTISAEIAEKDHRYASPSRSLAEYLAMKTAEPLHAS